MNLPEHRRAIHGRTLDRSFEPTDYAMIEHCTSDVRLLETVAGVLLAVAIGVGLAVALVAWWTS